MDNHYCKICLSQHDEEIHAATLSVRQWFHEQVNLSFITLEELEALAQPNHIFVTQVA